MEEDKALQIHVRFGGNIPIGHSAVILDNCPIAPFGDNLQPAFKLSVAQAFAVAIDLIHMAKMAQLQEQQVKAQFPIADSEAERCVELTAGGQCILRRAHDGVCMVFDGS